MAHVPRLQRSHEQEGAVQRRSATFQEAPGEPEADAARDAFLQRAAEPAALGAALATASDRLRGEVVSRLQRERGNAFVQRIAAGTRGAPGRLVGLPQSEMVQEVLQRKGAGSALPEPARENLEQHFAGDLGDVRVHADGEAATLNRELDAQAFTVGSDVFFAEGAYDPSSTAGQGLLAHELTHVGQQVGFPALPVQRDSDEQSQ